MTLQFLICSTLPKENNFHKSDTFCVISFSLKRDEYMFFFICLFFIKEDLEFLFLSIINLLVNDLPCHPGSHFHEAYPLAWSLAPNILKPECGSMEALRDRGEWAKRCTQSPHHLKPCLSRLRLSTEHVLYIQPSYGLHTHHLKKRSPTGLWAWSHNPKVPNNW